MDNKALFKLSYGLFLLSVEDKGKHNGCIVNTCVQVCEKPLRIAVSVQKNTLTHDMLMSSGKFNISTLTEKTDFAVFRHFGMQSGRDVDKFEGWGFAKKSPNGLYYLSDSCMYLCAKVLFGSDLGSHDLFIAEVTDAVVLSDEAPCTYDYYHKNIKPAPKQEAKGKWVCDVCGYVYEGDELPDDYICPLCKHGKDDFTYIPAAKEEKPTRWVCTVCGYAHEGEEPPEVCPLCKQPADKFRSMN